MVEGLADQITQNIEAPTIGIGASLVCDGQILVLEDIIGMNT
jgi:3-methyl-2-oxobutanoate hydroxymethyltransferase